VLAGQERGRREGTGVEMIFAHVEAEAFEFVVEVAWGAFAAIGEEEEFLLFRVEPIDKFNDARQKLVAVIDHAIHVADKATFSADIVESSHAGIRSC
jgi:hypothetical protein